MANGIPIAVGELIEAATINTWARGYLRKTTSKAVNTSTTATDLLNGEFTLPAGAMGTDKIVRLTAWGDWKQNAAAVKDIPTFRLLLGGTTLIDTGNLGTANAEQIATRYGWRIQCEIQNLGATNSQQAYFSGLIHYLADNAGPLQNAFNTGNGVVTFPSVSGPGSSAVTIYDGGNTGLTVDTTVACAVVLNVVNAFSNANYETKLYGALCEVI